MSLNKTLDRLFDEIRREAKRNPVFADRLDAVLRLHDSRRDVADEVMAEVGAEPGPPASSRPAPSSKSVAPAGKMLAVAVAPALNPVGYFTREGEDALAAVLAPYDRDALMALVEEHNLDPLGEAGEMDRDALAAHIVAQAKRRAERDSKLFDY